VAEDDSIAGVLAKGLFRVGVGLRLVVSVIAFSLSMYAKSEALTIAFGPAKVAKAKTTSAGGPLTRREAGHHAVDSARPPDDL
jgi:hypothetical protein